MLVGDDGAPRPYARATVPAPESPIWLPALSQVAGEAARVTTAAAAGALPRAKDLRAATYDSRDPRQLFDTKPFAQQQPPASVRTARLPALGARGEQLHDTGRRAQQGHDREPASSSSRPSGFFPGRGGSPDLALPGTGDSPSVSPMPHGRLREAQPGGADDALAQRRGLVRAASPCSLPPGAAVGQRPGRGGADPSAPLASAAFDPDRVPGVETGADAVAFFGRYGQDSPAKFFYCIRPPEGPRYRPYDLVVVPRQDVRDDYLTVSATGVVRIRKDAQAEFTPLAEWVREAALFDAIASIGYFRNYLTGRTFRAWVKVVRRKHFKRVCSAVEARLFSAKANFLPALSEIMGHVADLQAVNFCSANANHLHTLQEYAELQQAARDGRAKPAVEAVVERVQKVLERVCREVQAQAALYQESVRDEAELADTTGVELGQGRARAGRTRPMVVVKKEKMDRAANYSRIMEELSLLGNFVRLADYLVVGGVMGRALAAAEDTLALLLAGREAGTANNKGVFTTVVSFVPGGGTVFAPDAPAVMDEINGNTIEGALGLAQAAPRVLFMRAFAYLFDARPSGLNPLAILRAAPAFVLARRRINEAVAGDYMAARDAARALEDYRKVWEFGRTWDGDAYAAQPRGLAEIRRDLVIQRSWKGLLERMKTSLVVGCLQVDAKPLKAELIPVTQATQERIKLVLLSLARDATLAALEDMQGRIALLSARPSQLDGYMGYLVMHTQQVEDRKQLVASCAQIDDMYDSLAAHEQKVPTAEQVKHDDLTEALATFQAQLAEGKEWIADAKAAQLTALQSSVLDVNGQLEEMAASLHSGIYVDAEADPEAVVVDLEAMLQRLGGLGEALATYNQYLGLVDQSPDEGGTLMVAEKEASARYQLWLSLRDFTASSASWTEEAVLDDDGALLLEIEAIRAEVDDYATKAYKAAKAHKDDPVAARLKEVVEDFKEIMPLVEELANPALKLRHWEQVFALIGADVQANKGGTGYAPFSIRYLLQFDLLDNLEKLQAIGAQASKELSLEKALSKMKADWQGMDFRVVGYKDTGTYVIGGTDDVQALLDDHIVKAQTMRSSPFLKPFEAEALEWEHLLLRTQDLLDNWLTCQSTWQYLEPIFSSPDILAQMPEEGDKFQQVDATWRGLMEAAHALPSVLGLAGDQERLASLEEANVLLEQIQKGLAAYLEVKRLAFPRFFFLSNDEMLEILSETKDPTRVQPHLKKCFEGIDRLHFEPNGDITGMVSIEGELVPLTTRIRPATANGAVEKWLVQVEAGMVQSMRSVVAEGTVAYESAERADWVLQWPGQVVLAVTAIYWTQDVAAAIEAGAGDASALPACAERCGQQLMRIVELVRGELSALNRATLSALVVMDVHARDVATSLAADADVPGRPGCFGWTSQLRHYLEEAPAEEAAPPPRRASVTGPVAESSVAGVSRGVVLRMMNASVPYGYEYLGNSMRLVVTPLTDRCYRTLIGAIHLNMGGAPEGPAGTGKTETTKDLAKALARQCVVFNCSDTLDYTTMGKFFKGLASAGAWACFDEFNRIDLEVLSVVAQQVSEIQAAVRGRLKTFVFEGTELWLRPSCNTFITMNPGYAGRSELPDNLKALFRTVAMMVPDYAMIAEIMLFSSGYMKARECARKIVAIYRLCSEQLSSQDHYDYGMRAVMAVLRAAGNLKRRFPAEDEPALMLRAIVDVNLCKFLAHDVPLFNGILSDLFPGVQLPPPDYDALSAALRRQCAARGLQATEYFQLKATQLYEMVAVRHGLMLVGEAMSGKTSALQCLAGALGDLKEQGVEGPLCQKVVLRSINPKAVTMGQLYGEVDKATQEWKDGVLAVTFRSLASDPSPDRKWLVLDGPVDALWIENMNTVLDDNKKLCLPNSEIIAMRPTMSMIFEVGDLSAASPATVSRCGMVFLEPQQLGWRPLMASWLQTLPKSLGPKARKQLEALLEWLVPPCLRFVRKHTNEISPTSDAALARAAMRIIGALLGARPAGCSSAAAPQDAAAAATAAGADCEGLAPEDALDGPGQEGSGAGDAVAAALAGADDAAKSRLAEASLLFGLVWGVGGSCDADGRQGFNTFLRELLAGSIPTGFADLVPAKGPGVLYAPLMPHEGSVYDFVWDVKAPSSSGKGSGTWLPWGNIMPALAIPSSASFNEIIVPTADTARYTFMFDLALRQRYPLLLVGPTGTGKTTLIMRHLLGGGSQRSASGEAGQEASGDTSPDSADAGQARDKAAATGPALVGGLTPDKWVPVFLTLSARTTANMAQEQIDGRLDKRKKGVYGPPIGRRAIVFVDDLNMPSKETFGAQPPLELLRQAMDQNGWYSRDTLWRAMADVEWAAAMGPPGGGRTFISSRVLRHFSTLACTQVSDDTLTQIFGSILSWHFSKRGFPAQLASLAAALVSATLDVYSAAAAKLLPTPAKSHYLFNLRDFARVVQGIMTMPPSSLPKSPADAEGAVPDSASTPAVRVVKRLWVHEALRVFYDRLTDATDRDWLLGQLRGSCQSRLGENMDGLLGHLLAAPAAPRAAPGQGSVDAAAARQVGQQGVVGQEELRRLFFGDFVDPSADPLERPYAEMPDAALATAAVEEALADFNAQSRRPLPLAVFLFAVEHVSRVCRVLKQPGGNMLLVGVGGSGRQSVARLAAHIAGMEVFQVEVGKSYGRNEWREDLKACCRRAGAEGKRLVFLLSDGQLKEEAWLEDVNNLLNSGEVPNMFAADEKMQILEAVRPPAAQKGLESPLELWGFFVARTRTNLHLLLALSPAGAAFRERLRANPSLVNCCTIDWFWQWPSDALEAVALKELRQLDMDAATRRKLVEICQAVHNQVTEASTQFLSSCGRHNYVTPSSYLELLSTFRTLLEAARADNARQRKRYTTGLDKLAGSAQQVEGMQAELVALQPQLVKTVAEVEALMERIAHDKKHEVELKAAVVREDEAHARTTADAAKAIKDECEADLAEAIPILNDALSALDTIKEADITYMRKLANPPAAIKLVLEAVCVVLDIKPNKAKDESGKEIWDYWKPSVALLNDREFLSKLKSYDKDNIPSKIISVVRATYIPDEGFTPEVAKRASPAAEGLCKWVHAMSSYDKVAKVVAPKRAKLAEAEGTYEGVMSGLREKQKELQALLDRLAGMEADLKANTEKKERLEAEIEQCSIKLERAAALIGGLGGERTRWQEVAASLARAQECWTGDMLVAAATIAYLGAFTAPWRTRLVQAALRLCADQGVLSSPTFNLSGALGNPLKTRDWLIAGLPNDSFSIENAIIVSHARRWPLMIDPQGQANKWVRNLERPKNLQVLKPGNSSDFMRVLENAVQFGQPVLLENVGEELDPALEPLLAKQVFKQGGIMCIRLGDTAVEYSPDFRLYITTKMRNPHYLPELAVKVTLLNFMITPGGLSDQLLGVLVAAERPDLEQQKAALVVSGAENKRQLQEIEDRILEVLSSSTGNILEDETAVGVITAAKALGNSVAIKQQQAEETEAAIDAARLAYAPAGDHASTLFFCISDLATINPMYQYSLPWFTALLLGAARDAERPEDVPTRLAAVQRQFTLSLCRNVCRSLFEKDKLLFAFLLAARLMSAAGALDADEWQFFLTGGIGQPRGDMPNPGPGWLPDRSWRQLRLLSALPVFSGLDGAVSAAPTDWKAVFDSPEPHVAPLPGLFAKLDPFRRLCVLRCLRPDKVLPAAQQLVEARLGRAFVEPPPFDLGACYSDSSPTTPLIFVLSPGSDPAAALAQFSSERGMASRTTAISLGQGQGRKAAALIADAASSGSWVVLQNCHLAPSWMPDLEKICEDLSAENTNPAFRLWMTSYPSPKFPVNVLQNSVKMTNEPPQGLRANMRRSLAQEPLASDDFFEGCRRPAAFKRLAFGLVFFHALVQERRSFGPLGWNIPYGFDDGDQRISLRQLKVYLDEAPAPPPSASGGPDHRESASVPFAALCYVVGECNYGGRVTDDKDRLLLATLLERCVCAPLVDSPSTYSFASGPQQSGDSGGSGSGAAVYGCPEDGPRSAYVSYADCLPAAADPGAFGLHANADIAKDISATDAMLGSLLAMGASEGSGGEGEGAGEQSSSSGGTAGARSEEARLASVVADCLAALPLQFDVESVGLRFPVCYEESMNTVLVQEMARFNRLTAVIRDSLVSMQRALEGLAVMSGELEAAARSVALNQVPDLWKRVSYPSLKSLSSYVADLATRLEMLRSWADAGAPPASFCLPHFFFPHSFLTAGLQNYARRRKLPIDVVAYDFEALEPADGGAQPGAGGSGAAAAAEAAACLPDAPPEDGVFVHGLWLEGARWDAAAGCLAECEPRVLYTQAPVLWFRPRPVSEISDAGRYACPLYRTADRRGVLATTGHSTNFVTLVRLPVAGSAAHWVMRGAALLSQLSD